MKNFIQYCLVAILMLQLTACVDQEFDVPPGREIQVEDISTTTIAALKATHVVGDNASAIADGTVIKGTVISDDTQGSFYKELIIQDESAGILIRVNRGDLSVVYGAGRQVFIKCDGLYIGDYNGLTQIGYPGGGANIDRIPDVFVEKHLVLGQEVGKVTPRVINKIGELDDSMISTLISLQKVEFEAALLGGTLAPEQSTFNRIIEDCDKDQVILRASGYSDFASMMIPEGNGTVTAILSKFNSSYQITVAEPADFMMEDPRCDGSSGVQVEDISNKTIADVLSTHTIGDVGTPIAAGTILKGTVISDDSQGSFYKELVIQDESAGVLIRIDRKDNYQSYNPGRRVFINCDGLVLGDYNGLYQIGYPGDDTNINRIPADQIGKHIIRGEVLNNVTAKPISDFSEINDGMINTLVELNMVEFASSELGQVFAPEDGPNNQNRKVNDCNANEVILRTSKFTDFAKNNIPEGNGTIRAIIGKYNATYQIGVAKGSDFNMTAPRCSDGGSGVDGDKINISDLQALFANGTTTAPNGYIEGVVISDFAQGNINNRNLVLQDDNAGIIVRFASPHSIPLGQSLKVSTNNVEISEFNGGLQINVADNAYEDNGAGTLPAPRVATIAELLANFQAWESTLVKIVGAELSGGSTISAINTITDATGSISTFTFNSAAFADEAAPTGMVDVTGIVSEYNDMQLTFRSRADIEGGSTGGGGGTGDLISLEALRTAFESGTTSAPNGYVEGVVISDYTTGSVTGRNLHLQDPTGGIVIRFSAAHEYALGSSLKVNIGGTELSEYNGLLQLNNVDPSQIESVSTGTLPTPRAATLAEVASNLEDWESTLVVIENVTFSGNNTFEGALTADDGTASLTMYTRGAATFSGSSVPSGPVTVTAIVTQFNDAQILIRSLDDIN